MATIQEQHNEKAFDAAVKLVNSSLSLQSIGVDEEAGKDVAAYFKAIYNGLKEITDELSR